MFILAARCVPLYPAISTALTEKALQLCPDVESERTDETEKIDWNSGVAFNLYSNIFKSYIPIQLPIFSRKKSARDLRSEVNIFLNNIFYSFQGSAYFSGQEFEKAIECYRKCIASSEILSVLFSNIAASHLKLENYYHGEVFAVLATTVS